MANKRKLAQSPAQPTTNNKAKQSNWYNKQSKKVRPPGKVKRKPKAAQVQIHLAYT